MKLRDCLGKKKVESELLNNYHRANHNKQTPPKTRVVKLLSQIAFMANILKKTRTWLVSRILQKQDIRGPASTVSTADSHTLIQ